jgi:proteasome assembly chaperone (PAC2) family protein
MAPRLSPAREGHSRRAESEKATRVETTTLIEMSLDYARWRDRPALDRPILIAAFDGWNDAGDAATWAVRHLAQRWDTQPFADIDPEPFFDFSQLRPVVELEGDERTLRWPENGFSATQDPRPLILLQGIEPQLRWRTFTKQVISVAQAYDAAMVVTLGALLAEVPHSRPVSVYGGSEDPELRDRLELEQSSYEGPTGIVGVLNTAARAAGIPSASLWAAVPNYVSGAASPKAALALLDRLQQALEIGIPVTDLEIATSAYERQITELVSEDQDTASYIRTLEEQYDDGELAEPDPASFVEEVEQFLRDQPD